MHRFAFVIHLVYRFSYKAICELLNVKRFGVYRFKVFEFLFLWVFNLSHFAVCNHYVAFIFGHSDDSTYAILIASCE